MVHERKYRNAPIESFLIPAEGQTIGVGDWASREPESVWYGMPENCEYRHPSGGSYTRCRVEAFGTDEISLGYIPLPQRYAEAWVQLCYTVVYWMSEWKAWVAELGKPVRDSRQPANFVRDCANNAGTRFLQYLIIHHLVVDKLLEHAMSKDRSDELLVFDEYLIRERFDWLWTDPKDIPDRSLENLWLDPVHEKNWHIFNWQNPKLFMPLEMITPPASPVHTWMWGAINHFDFQRLFNESFANVLRFYRSKTLRKQAEEVPYRLGVRGLPDLWHEGHEPTVHFLSAQEDRLFGCRVLGPAIDSRRNEHQAGESSLVAQQPVIGMEVEPDRPLPTGGEQAARPSDTSGGNTGIIDNERARAIVAAFAQHEGGISLHEAHMELENALGSRFDAQAWGQLLDRVVSAPGEQPLMSIEEAFRSYGGGDSHAKSMQDSHDIVKTFL